MSSKYQAIETITAGIAEDVISKGMNVIVGASDGYVKQCDAASPKSLGAAVKDYKAGDVVAVVRQGFAYGVIESVLSKGTALSQTVTGGFDAAADAESTTAFLEEEAESAGQVCKIFMVVTDNPIIDLV